jgi:hypothetical protein
MDQEVPSCLKIVCPLPAAQTFLESLSLSCGGTNRIRSGYASRLYALAILFSSGVGCTSAWMEARGGVWQEDGAVSWIVCDSPIQGGRRAENVGSRWTASSQESEFWRAYPECSGAEYGLEGPTYFAERSGCAIGIAALKMAASEHWSLGRAASVELSGPCGGCGAAGQGSRQRTAREGEACGDRAVAAACGSFGRGRGRAAAVDATPSEPMGATRPLRCALDSRLCAGAGGKGTARRSRGARTRQSFVSLSVP